MNTVRNHLELSRRLLYRALGGGVLAVACLACLAGSALASTHARWSRTAIAREPENCPYHAPVTAFDTHGVLWAFCQLRGDAGGIFVGRLTRGYRVLYPYLIPGTVGLPPMNMSLAINRAGIAVLAWGYRTAILGPYAVGVAAATWRVGHAPSSATILAPARMQGGSPGVAVNASGIAVVAFGDAQGLSAARFSHGHLLGVTRLATASEAVSSIELLAGKAVDSLLPGRPRARMRINWKRTTGCRLGQRERHGRLLPRIAVTCRSASFAGASGLFPPKPSV